MAETPQTPEDGLMFDEKNLILGTTCTDGDDPRRAGYCLPRNGCLREAKGSIQRVPELRASSHRPAFSTRRVGPEQVAHIGLRASIAATSVSPTRVIPAIVPGGTVTISRGAKRGPHRRDERAKAMCCSANITTGRGLRSSETAN